MLYISIIFAVLFCFLPAGMDAMAFDGEDGIQARYQEYRRRFDAIETRDDIAANGFEVMEAQVFPVTLENFGEVIFLPALELEYSRMAIFLAQPDGRLVYKTDQLETNYKDRGELKQPNQGIAAVSFQDMDQDGLTDIALITSCENRSGLNAPMSYKVADVLFQKEAGFYRDYRVSDKLNRFSMNKSIDYITAYLRDGKSTEFLYTAATLDELLAQGFQVASQQCYTRTFKKMGKLQVVPGTYSMADCETFLIYLVDEQGDIVWSFQPMGDYDNLYALKGINCRDIDGDGLKDVIVLARYNYVDDREELMAESDYAIYYQRTGGFSEDTEFKKQYRCTDTETVDELVKKARAYWGWQSET